MTISNVPDPNLSDYHLDIFEDQAYLAVSQDYASLYNYSFTEVLNVHIKSQQKVGTLMSRNLRGLQQDNNITYEILLSINVSVSTRKRYGQILSAVATDALSSDQLILELKSIDEYFRFISIKVNENMDLLPSSAEGDPTTSSKKNRVLNIHLGFYIAIGCIVTSGIGCFAWKQRGRQNSQRWEAQLSGYDDDTNRSDTSINFETESEFNPSNLGDISLNRSSSMYSHNSDRTEVTTIEKSFPIITDTSIEVVSRI